MTDITSDGPKPWDLDRYRPSAPVSGAAPPLPPGRVMALEPGEEPERHGHRFRFREDGESLFFIALTGILLSAITLGLYRFWMLTKIRRHYWRAVTLDGDPLEYTGRGLEKLLGFLIAVIILAIYLGVVSLAMTFVAFAVIGGDPTGGVVFSTVALIPFLFYASYRSTRYILSRSRWRGIRCGLDEGAVTYTLRMCGMAIPVLLTGGLLYPWLHYNSVKFMTDRASFGSLRFRQEGGWVPLFSAWLWIYVVIVMAGLLIWGLIDTLDFTNPTAEVSVAINLVLIGSLVYLAVYLLYLNYQAAAYRHFWSNRTLGGAPFNCELSGTRVIGITIVGNLLTTFLTTVLGIVVFLTIVLFFFGIGFGDLMMTVAAGAEGGGDGAEGEIFGGATEAGGFFAAAIAAYVIGYVLVLAIGFAFYHLFVMRRLIEAQTDTTTVFSLGRILRAQQRAHDPAAEAGGFADALGVDMGAGF